MHTTGCLLMPALQLLLLEYCSPNQRKRRYSTTRITVTVAALMIKRMRRWRVCIISTLDSIFRQESSLESADPPKVFALSISHFTSLNSSRFAALSASHSLNSFSSCADAFPAITFSIRMVLSTAGSFYRYTHEMRFSLCSRPDFFYGYPFSFAQARKRLFALVIARSTDFLDTPKFRAMSSGVIPLSIFIKRHSRSRLGNLEIA